MSYTIEQPRYINTLASVINGFSGNFSEGQVHEWHCYPVALEDVSLYQPFVNKLYPWNSNGHDEYHQADHIFRCLVLSLQLSRYYQDRGVAVDESELLWSGVFHDAGSYQNETGDHGERGVAIAEPWIHMWFSPRAAQRIFDSIRWHNKPPEDVPQSVWTIEHLILRTADTLELQRIPDDRTIKLLIPDAVHLLPIAKAFIGETTGKNGHDVYENVTGVAVQMGLLVA